MHKENGFSDKKECASGGAATLYLLGAIHLGLFAFATGQVPSDSAAFLGIWILGCAVALLLLAMVELYRGELFTGTIRMVFGGLLGLGAALSFIRSLWTPGILPIDGWWFLSAGIMLFLLLAAAWRISRLLFNGLTEIGVALTILGLGMIGTFGSPATPLKIAGWGALIFAVFCWYSATAQMVNAVYGRKVLPL
jgi:succinate-acetate transporter protein